MEHRLPQLCFSHLKKCTACSATYITQVIDTGNRSWKACGTHAQRPNLYISGSEIIPRSTRHDISTPYEAYEDVFTANWFLVPPLPALPVHFLYLLPLPSTSHVVVHLNLAVFASCLHFTNIHPVFMSQGGRKYLGRLAQLVRALS